MRRTKTTKQAVSLIVLVITIIVMIILAGTIILSLDNSGIIDKAQTAVDKTNLAEIKNLAQMAWAEAYLDDVRDEDDLKEAVEAALSKQQITEKDYEGYTLEVTANGVKFVEEAKVDPALNHSGIIPEGGVYYRGLEKAENDIWDWENSDITTYTAGQAFPTGTMPGDVYEFDDYRYMYNASRFTDYEQFEIVGGQNGWGVVYLGGLKHLAQYLKV